MSSSLVILLCDDNVDWADTLTQCLELRGHSVITTYDGIEALSSFASANPDVCLLDIGLPGKDGYQLAKEIRGSKAKKHPLLVAITGYDSHADKAKARDAGFDVHLTKPVSFSTLEKILGSPPEPRCA